MMDIIDRIDELVDESLAAGEPEGGYETWSVSDPDPDYPRCPHCQRHWHGLPITARIARMYATGQYDPDYEYATDTTPVLCDGSDFIGPIRPPRPQITHRDIAYRITIDTYARAWDEARQTLVWIQERLERLSSQFATLTFTLPNPAPQPPKCLQPHATITFGQQNWHHELLRIPPDRQFPRPYYLRSPLEIAVSQLWPEFTAPDFPTPPSPGYDFTAWNDTTPPTTGPEQHPRRDTPTPHHHRPATTRRRNGRRTRG